MKKVKIIIISDGDIDERCLESVYSQDYGNIEVLISVKTPALYSRNATVYNYNIMEHREEARLMGLGSTADYFLFIDDDIKLPLHAVSHFVKFAESKPIKLPDEFVKSIGATQNFKKKHCATGHVKTFYKGKDYWMSGRFVADNTFAFASSIPRGEVKTDLVAMGCFFISREILEKINFDIGLDENLKLVRCNICSKMLFDECFIVAERVQSEGCQIYASGNVVCEHLTSRFEEIKNKGFFRKLFNAIKS